MLDSGRPVGASPTSATSLLPEAFVGELEPFLVHSQIEILANLRVLIDQKVLAAVYYDHESSFILTRFLNINPEFEELVFDLGPEHRANEKLLASEGLTVVAFVDHIKVQFSVKRAELTQFENAPAFRVRAPRSILRLQRRAAFRARTQSSPSPYILLPPTPDKFGKSDTARIKIVDISANGFALVAPLGRPVLTSGMQLPRCLLELEATTSFDVDVEIRHVAVTKDGFGREMCRAGCYLLNISSTTEMVIQRYVNRIGVGKLNRR